MSRHNTLNSVLCEDAAPSTSHEHTADSASQQPMPDNVLQKHDSVLHALAGKAQQRAIQQRRRRQAKPSAPTRSDDPYLSPTQREGRAGECLARRHLEAEGLRVLACNLASRSGEIDLVCLDGNTLVFVEVRLRRDARYGGAGASVNRRKQQRLIRTAQYYLPRLVRLYFAGRTPPCRFDIVAIDPPAVNWLKSAFATD